MKFDELGLPQDNGSTDKQDSARLAGLLTVFEWPQKVDCSLYVVDANKRLGGISIVEIVDGKKILHKYVRHPQEYRYNFSRDQSIPLMAGLFKQNETGLVNKEYITGRDLFSPSQNGHVRICQGLKPRWYQSLWLWIDVVYSALFAPLYEPNQLACMMLVHPNKNYLKKWTKWNPKWRQAFRQYWSTGAGAWRGEPELCEHMIKFIESKV